MTRLAIGLNPKFLKGRQKKRGQFSVWGHRELLVQRPNLPGFIAGHGG